MVSFQKPKFTFSFDFDTEIQNLHSHKAKRGIPDKDPNKLLICTWNIANLGLHKRNEDHYRLIAEIISWFDIIAIQEVHDNLEGLYLLEQFIGTEYGLLFNDRGGNDERAAFFYDSSKIERLQLTGELAIPQAEHRWIKIKGIDAPFKGFDRNPFIATFQFKETRLMLLNAHLYFGSDNTKNKNRRALEAYAIARYAHLRRDDKHTFTSNIMALGDFNIPLAKPGDIIYDALTKRGMKTPKHSTKMGSSISTDAQYDQIVFFPNLKKKIKNNGVYDYDNAIFPDLWIHGNKDFKTYCRYYISDHRPMWVQVEF